ETTQTIVASKSTNDLLQPGESCPLEDSYCRKTISTEEGLLAVENAGQSGWSDDSAYETFELETYIGGRIVVNGDLYGTICFADAESRRREFSEMERTFVELLTRWMAYELERQEHLSQLETTNARLAEFASIVSHDLRNPLSVANGYLELVAQDHDIPELAEIERAHSRMQELIDDILLLARDGTVIGELTAVDLAETSESCWNTVETADATLRIETDRTILADESRLRQLIENLVRNAVEHGGSDVTVTIGDLPDGFFIEDSGVGIPDDRVGSLFEPGYSTEETNTGLGLRIVEQIVDAHGWEIRVTSGTDGGARFEITGVETA
ncbi:MAG: HAMP domain-containing sensor histidine kinase, partial [Natronomonas sp.]